MKKPQFTYYCLLLAALLVCGANRAQQSAGFIYEFFNTSHGLPAPEINALENDGDGFLWLGTAAGLSKFDGYTFHNYPYDSNNELIGVVTALKRDAQNRLWIGSGGGLFCLVNNRIIKLSASGTYQTVNDIMPDADGSVWLATSIGPAHIYEKDIDFTGQTKLVISKFIPGQWKLRGGAGENNTVNLIAKAADGALYMAQPLTLYKFYNGQIQPVHTLADVNDIIINILPVSNNKVYVDAARSEMQLIENGFHRYLPVPGHLQKGGIQGGPGLWYLGTRGIFNFNTETGAFLQFINTMDRGVIQPKKLLVQNNLFWVASADGLIKVKPSFITIYNLKGVLPHSDYYSFLQLRNGPLLLGSNRGIIAQKNNRGFSLVKKEVVSRAEIKYLYEDENGWLWAASGYQGIALLRHNKTERYTTADGLHDNSIFFLLKTGDNRMFACGDYGLSQVLTGEAGRVSFRKFRVESRISKNASFYAAIDGPDGTVWAAGQEGLVYIRNGVLRHFRIPGLNVPLNFIIKDKKGAVWIATNGAGLLKCIFNNRQEPEIVQRTGEKEGLNTLNYITLLADMHNNIWAGSSKGLSFIGQDSANHNRVINFSGADGFLQPGYSYIQLYQAADGIIWAAASTGLASFNPAHAVTAGPPPAVHLTGIWQSGHPLQPGQNRFSHRQNAFRFSYAALDFSNPGELRYFYKLAGVDTGWTAAANLRTVSYENLAPGHYSFHVKALGNKGIWSRRDAVYTFYITTPFWRRWWFRLAVLLAAALAVLAYFRQRELRIREREAGKVERLEALRQNREKEMELLQLSRRLATLQLTALRSQMNPHFLFNALNSIQQFTLQGDFDNANRYLAKFSQLLRKVLQSSGQNFLLLDEELEQLRLYLDIEQLRMGPDFVYTISVDDEIEPGACKIPGMAIQPFIENSLKHGLPLKEGAKLLEVSFSLYNDENIQVRIADNGIGRARAAEINAIQEKLLPHESKGIQLIHERLQLLSRHSHETIRFEDRTDGGGRPAGTIVWLLLPLKN